TLGSNSPDILKSYDLTWLLHLVGDVHQPLHCSTRVSSTDREGDRGGNNVKLDCGGCGPELHAFWDDVLGTSESPTTVIAFARGLPVPDATLAAVSDEKVWVAESFQATQEQVYVSPVGGGDGPFALTDGYRARAKTLAGQRIALAGARLTALL